MLVKSRPDLGVDRKVRKTWCGDLQTKTNVTVLEHPQKQQDGSGVSEKNFEMCDEKQQKQGLFEKVKRIFKVS